MNCLKKNYQILVNGTIVGAYSSFRGITLFPHHFVFKVSNTKTEMRVVFFSCLCEDDDDCSLERQTIWINNSEGLFCILV